MAKMLSNVKKFMVSKTGRAGLKLKKYSPEILLGVGVASIIGGTVLACKATLKIEEIVEEKDDRVKKIKEAKENYSEDKYSAQDYQKDLAITYIQATVKIGKLYAPAATLTAVGIGCILTSHNIMKQRNLALMAAYKLIEKGYSEYRQRVIADLGIEKDREYRYGIKKETVEEEVTDAKGKTKTVKKEVSILEGVSDYAKFFDESSNQWSKSPEYNLTFLKCQQNSANDMLKSRGHVFLNEVYDMLGIPRTDAGSIVGWIDGDGDSYIDFGIYDVTNYKKRDFVNGYERSILLDFNVDGVIYDLI